MFAAFGPEKDMQIYGHGIRRRAATMLGGDGPRLRMAWSLMLSLPGTPVILYGDEIGMGEDLAREGRMAVRMPMQWDEVDAQRRDDDSLLQFMSKLAAPRATTTPELGWGTSTLLENEPPALFAHRCDWQGSTVFALHNLSRRGGRPPSSTSATTSTASTTCSSCATTASRAVGCASSSAPTATCGCARRARADSRRARRPRPRRRASALVGRQPQLR